MQLASVLAVLALVASATAISLDATPGESPVDYLKRAVSPGVVITHCAKPGVLALAFDDGPYQYTRQLVDTLNAAGAKGTFFMTGTLYGCIYNYADSVKYAFNSGHQIASHTWTHPSNFGSLDECGLTKEIRRVEQAFVNIIGKKPAYMRPPYLATGGVVLPTMAKLGYKVITDDVDSEDWNGKTPEYSEAKFIAAGATNTTLGHIPLMHEPIQTTVQVLVPWLINWAQENNLQLVTVAECLNDVDGMYQAGLAIPNGGTTCSK